MAKALQTSFPKKKEVANARHDYHLDRNEHLVEKAEQEERQLADASFHYNHLKTQAARAFDQMEAAEKELEIMHMVYLKKAEKLTDKIEASLKELPWP